MPINQVGSITTPEPRTINIQVWDTNNVNLVDAAIKKSELGLNPQIDGQLVRLPIPDLSEERRTEMKKIVKSMEIALRKRKVDNDVVERAQNGIVRQLESSGEVEIQSDLIGELMTKIEDLESKIVELSKEPAEDGIKYNPEGTKKVNKKSLISLSHHERVRELINNYK